MIVAHDEGRRAAGRCQPCRRGGTGWGREGEGLVGSLLLLAVAVALHGPAQSLATAAPLPLPLPEAVVRVAGLVGPLALLAALVRRRRPDRPTVAAAVAATAWQVPALLAANVLAVGNGWWSFDVGSGLVAGVPLELWVGWAVLWGAVPAVVGIDRLASTVALLVAADLVVMPLAEPTVDLRPTWLVGEVVAVATCLVPGAVLARWTARGECLPGRVGLQMVGFAGLTGFVVPTVVFAVSGGGWDVVRHRPLGHLAVAGIVLAPVVGLIGQALREFAAHGGTPMPLDPPADVVATGPYAFVANPMQLGMVVLLAAWGVLLGSPGVVAVGLVGAPVFSVTVARRSEEHDMGRRFGGRWDDYRREVRAWVPRWRPGPIGSEAEERHLGWGIVRWTLRLPIIHQVVRTWVDVDVLTGVPTGSAGPIAGCRAVATGARAGAR